MNNKQKLELTWIGKGKEPKLESRILLYDQEKSYGDQDTENMLIHGDNLLALKALEQEYAEKIKCIYIDPPYNTGSAFEQYDDNLEHSTWLNLMKPRLELLQNLLSEDGSIWISIDDDEQAYLKVLCDEVFGRKNYITTNVWQKRTSPDMRATISDGHEYIMVFAKDKSRFKNTVKKLPLNEDQKRHLKILIMILMARGRHQISQLRVIDQIKCIKLLLHQELSIRHQRDAVGKMLKQYIWND